MTEFHFKTRLRLCSPPACLRGRLKIRFLCQAVQHQSAHRNLHPSCAALRQFLIIFAQTPLPTQPAQCARHCPTPRQHRKTTLPRRARRYLQAAAQPFPHPFRQRAAIRAISPNQPPPRHLARQFPQYRPGAIAVRHIRRGRYCRQRQPRRIYHNMTLAARHFFAGIVTARPTFSVVFTDWRSIMAASGSGWRPSLYRSCWRKAPFACCQTPALRQVR